MVGWGVAIGTMAAGGAAGMGMSLPGPRCPQAAGGDEAGRAGGRCCDVISSGGAPLHGGHTDGLPIIMLEYA